VRNPFRRTSAPPKLKSPDDTMTLRDHLAELRSRIVRSVLAVAVGFTVILVWYAEVLDFLTKPYARLCERGIITPGASQNCGDLISLSPVDAFGARVSISVYGGLILALPVLMWQLWRFIAPALHTNEKRYAVPFILSSVGLFLLGCLLAYLTLEPALRFLIDFGQAQPTYQISKYVSFVGLMAAAFGVGFQFPVLLVFLQLANVVKWRQLLSWWRYAIVLIVVLAAAITPSGDPISLAALALPMLLLYFVAVLIGWFIARRRERRAAAAS
jgi:sec-independent protein translocase protein TatC